MGNRRFAQVSTSDEDSDAPKATSSSEEASDDSDLVAISRVLRRKRIRFDEEEDEVEQERKGSGMKSGNEAESRAPVGVKAEEKQRVKEEEEDDEDDEAAGEPFMDDAKTIGDVVRVSGKGRGRREHYEAFEFDGNRFGLEDPVLLTPENEKQKPYVAIIKDISKKKDGGIMVTGQWFYRPEEARKKVGGCWRARDTRELFYSFHRDEVPAESVMHKCVVHFIPLGKQLPRRKEHPGFIVQKVYDTERRALFRLTDKDYEDNKQHEIDLLVQKTTSRLGSLVDVEVDDAHEDLEEQTKSKRLLKKQNISPLDISRENGGIAKSHQHLKAETPESCVSYSSKYCKILADFKVLSKETQRDKWLERLLQGVEYIFLSSGHLRGDQNGPAGSNAVSPSEGGCKSSDAERSLENGGKKIGTQLVWPDSAVSAVVALEKATDELLSSDFTKYNQKMRQLVFNLKNNAVLATRLLKGELEPSKILVMGPNELKVGLTAEEIARNKPEESAQMQMTDARCRRCTERKVGLVDIIQAGHGDRYQLECIACGNTWYASRDEAATLTIDGPNTRTTVGVAPLATAKFDIVEKKKLVSPRDPMLKKSAEAHMPVLKTQKKLKTDGSSAEQ